MKIKTTLLLITLITVLAGCKTILMGPQTLKEERQLTKIYEFPDQEKDELYNKVNSWFVKSFTDANSVIEYQDREAGKVMGKYIFSFAGPKCMTCTYKIRQTISVDIQDYRIRVLISDPYYDRNTFEGNAGTKWIPFDSKEGLKTLMPYWEGLAESLKKDLSKEDEW